MGSSVGCGVDCCVGTGVGMGVGSCVGTGVGSSVGLRTKRHVICPIKRATTYYCTINFECPSPSEYKVTPRNGDRKPWSAQSVVMAP